MRMFVHELWIRFDRATGCGNARCVPDGKIIEVANAALQGNFHFAFIEGVHQHGIRRWFFGFRQQFLNIERGFFSHL